MEIRKKYITFKVIFMIKHITPYYTKDFQDFPYKGISEVVAHVLLVQYIIG